MKIYAGNLAKEVTQDELKQAFEAFGKVESAVIITDKFSGESRGFGFVEMLSNEEAQAAIAGLNGKDIKGKALNVSEARPRPEGRSGGGRRGGGGGRGGPRREGGRREGRGGFGGERRY